MKTMQVAFKNQKGLTLRGIVTLPEGEGPFPVLINLHGFGDNKCGFKNLHVVLARELAAQGFGCIRFDFSNNGDSDGTFEDMTFTSLIQDTTEIWSWAKAQDYVDSDHCVLSGHSMGGFVASTAAPLISPAGLILMCPGKQMWDGCGERSRMMEQQGIPYGDIAGLKFNHAFNYDLETYHPFEDAANYHGPVLILRGTADELVNNETCETYRSIYTHPDSQYISIENADHNFSGIPYRTALYSEISKFMEQVSRY